LQQNLRTTIDINGSLFPGSLPSISLLVFDNLVQNGDMPILEQHDGEWNIGCKQDSNVGVTGRDFCAGFLCGDTIDVFKWSGES
jgi:hypothetical protein